MKPVFRAALLGMVLLSLRVGAQQYDIRVFGVEDGLPGSTVTAISQDSAGFLWVETDGGVCKFDGKVFKMWSQGGSPELPATNNVAPSASHTRQLSRPQRMDTDGRPITAELVAKSTGYLWRALDMGIRVFALPDTSRPLHWIDQENGLGGNDVTCLFEDRSGMIWIGSRQGGLSRYSSDAIQLYGLTGGPRSQVRAFTTWPLHDMVLGTGRSGTWFEIRESSSGSTTGMCGTCVARLSEDHMLIGTDSGAVLFRIFGKNGTGIHGATRFVRDLDIAHAISLNDGSAWIATDKGVHAVTSDMSSIRVGRDSYAASFLMIKDDSVLIGTHHGLYSAPLDNSAANWTPIIRAGQEDITCLTVDRADNIWIGTENAGVVRYRNGTTQRWTTENGLASDRIRQLLLDAYQNLWVGTDRGFHLMELDEMQEQVIDISYYGIEEGFPGIEAMPNACMLDTDSSLWFGTTRGTIHFDPRKVLEDPIAPHTRVTDLALFFDRPDWRPWSDTVDADGLPMGLKLPHDKNHLTFTFTGLSLAYPEKVRFQYMLEGRDADWSPITKEDKVTFSGLEPGEYTFLVKARNGSGVWNDEPARFTFSITPPFWATTPFRASGGAALLLGFYGLQRLRDRRSRKARERLERIVATRTRELTEEKQRSDTLLLNILPETTAAELKEHGSAQARSYTECTVLFSDFQGFTVLSEQFEATGIVTELDRFFRAFDRITDKFGTEKIKTIGDAYMCASGVPEPSTTHALDAVLMALEMLSVVDSINAQRISEGHPAWPIRIGLHSGPLIAGVVGEKKFAYDVWGDTVNLASRMESNGAPGRVNVTGSVMRHVEAYVISEARGKVMIKGKGEIESWFVDRLRPEYSADAQGRTANEHLLGLRASMRAR